MPVTPQQIADSAIEAARAGAAIAHIHVRDPGTGGARATRAVPRGRRARARRRHDVVLNLTAGMGGDFVLGARDRSPWTPPARTWRRRERLVHVDELRPEICTLDCGSMNFAATALRHGHARHAARMARASASRRAARDRGLRAGAHLARQAADRRGPDRRPGDVPALHGHPLRGAGRPRALLAMATACRPARASRPSRSAGCRCRTSRRPSSRAAMSASGSRTTSTSTAGCWRRTASSSSAPRDPRGLGARVLGPADARARLGLEARGDRLRAVGLVGAGVIGGGWAARLARTASTSGLGPRSGGRAQGRARACQRRPRARRSGLAAAAARGRLGLRLRPRMRSRAPTSCRRARPSARR